MVDLAVVALVRTGTLPTAGSVKVALYFTGALGLTAANAENNASLRSALTTTRETFATAGVSVSDDVTFTDVDPALATVDLRPQICVNGELDDIGHFLGLFHTVEQVGSADALADTLDSSSADASGYAELMPLRSMPVAER